MKKLVFVGFFLTSLTAFGKYNGDVMMVCDTAEERASIIASAKNLIIRDGQAILKSKDAQPDQVLDLKSTTECRFEAVSEMELTK